MRTRRSPRNQERLWRYLTPEVEKPKIAPTPILTDEEIDAMWWMPKQSRRMAKMDAAKRRRKEATMPHPGV